MAEFHSGFIVVLEADMADENTKGIIDAIKMIKGVIDVKPVTKEPTDKRIEKSRVKQELVKVVTDFLEKQ